MSNELIKTIEAQGRLITELRAENERLKQQITELTGFKVEEVYINKRKGS
jgi:cell division protein FtsB